MIVVVLTHLNKEQATPKVIDDGLITCRVPPLDRVVVLPARGEEPERRARPFERLDLPEPVLLRFVDVQVALERCDPNPQSELLVQVLDEAVEKVPWLLVAAVNKGIVAVHHLHFRVVLQERCQVRIVKPEFGAGRPNIGEELAWVAAMQIAHRGSEHHDIAGRLEVSKNQLAHIRTTPHVERNSADRVGSLIDLDCR